MSMPEDYAYMIRERSRMMALGRDDIVAEIDAEYSIYEKISAEEYVESIKASEDFIPDPVNIVTRRKTKTGTKVYSTGSEPIKFTATIIPAVTSTEEPYRTSIIPPVEGRIGVGAGIILVIILVVIAGVVSR